MSVLADLVASLAVAVLNWWAAREDIKRGERQRLLIDALGLERAALEWMVAAQRDPVRWARLRVRDGAGTLSDVQLDPDAPGPTADR